MDLLKGESLLRSAALLPLVVLVLVLISSRFSRPRAKNDLAIANDYPIPTSQLSPATHLNRQPSVLCEKMLGGLAGLGGGLSNFKLKKTRPSVPWVDLNIYSFSLEGRKKSPTIRMRDIDGLRLHVPILEERDSLKIPQSSDRLILSDQMNLMMLCGGYAGVHFTPEEMTQLILFAAEFDQRFRTLEDFFNTLSTGQKSFVHKEPEVIEAEVLPPPPGTGETEIAIPPPATPQMAHDPAIQHFHAMADNLISLLCEIQPLVKLKQTHVPSIG
jgi:hypothetical protein